MAYAGNNNVNTVGIGYTIQQNTLITVGGICEYSLQKFIIAPVRRLFHVLLGGCLLRL